MSDTPANKLLENEVIFQRLNESIKTQVESVFRTKARHLPLEFFCECSNEDCYDRIRIDPERFAEVHAVQRNFFVKPGHQLSKIEKTIKTCDGYDIVQKIKDPPAHTDMELNPTDL